MILRSQIHVNETCHVGSKYTMKPREVVRGDTDVGVSNVELVHRGFLTIYRNKCFLLYSLSPANFKSVCVMCVCLCVHVHVYDQTP